MRESFLSDELRTEANEQRRRPLRVAIVKKKRRFGEM